MRRNKIKLITLTLFCIGLTGLKAQTVKDIDGNIYNTIAIGTQVWMKENLKVTKYRNGELIGTTTPATLDISDQSTPKYQWAYDGKESNVITYGRLYTFYAVTDIRNICPIGWHVPSDTEWTILTTHVGVQNVGGKLKETGTTHWESPNSGATNESGFTALPGGNRGNSGAFSNIGYGGYWRSSTVNYTNYAWFRYLSFNSSNVSTYPNLNQSSGLSVRCLKDY